MLVLGRFAYYNANAKILFLNKLTANNFYGFCKGVLSHELHKFALILHKDDNPDAGIGAYKAIHASFVSSVKNLVPLW